MLSFSLVEARMERVGKEPIRGTEHVRCLLDKAREARVTWFGFIQRWDSDSINVIERR